MKSRKVFFLLSLTWFGAMLGIVVCGILFGVWGQRSGQLTKTEMRSGVHPAEHRAIAPAERNEVFGHAS
jgi:hypothetical protein